MFQHRPASMSTGTQALNLSMPNQWALPLTCLLKQGTISHSNQYGVSISTNVF